MTKAPPKVNTLCNLWLWEKHHPERLGCEWKGRREGVGFWKIEKKVAVGGALACHVSVTELQQELTDGPRQAAKGVGTAWGSPHGPTASPSASPGLRVHAGRRPLPAPRVCVYVPALASLRVVSSVQCSPEGWGPLVGVESSKAAAAQRVSDTPWREARSGLVKHDPLAEPLSFPCSPSARLPPSPLWPCGAGGLSFTPAQHVTSSRRHLQIRRFHLKVKISSSSSQGRRPDSVGAELWPPLWVGRLGHSPHHSLLSQAPVNVTLLSPIRPWQAVCDILPHTEHTHTCACARTHTHTHMRAGERAVPTGCPWKEAVALLCLEPSAAPNCPRWAEQTPQHGSQPLQPPPLATQHRVI